MILHWLSVNNIFGYSPIDSTRQSRTFWRQKKGLFKSQMYVEEKLDAGRMKKNDLTLPIWNILKNRLFQLKESMLQVVRIDSMRPIKTRKESHYFKISIIQHLQVKKGELTLCQRCTGNSGSSRLQIIVATKPLRGVSCYQAPRSMTFPDIRSSSQLT